MAPNFFVVQDHNLHEEMNYVALVRYQLSDHHLSAELVPTFADRGCHVVSVMDPSGRILG
jgi:CBS-domain-containing membrane protein